MTTKIDDFIKRVESTAEEDFFTPRTYYHLSFSMFHEMCEWLKEQQEIVRCKDFVHWIPGTITDKDDFIQPRCKRNGGGWSSDEYCSCAEKRTDKI